MIAVTGDPLVLRPMLSVPEWAAKAFPKPLSTNHVVGKRKVQLKEDFEVRTKTLGTIIVPKGYVSDGATVPQAFWVLFPPFGKYLEAAVLHDFIYTDLCWVFTKAQADLVFKELLEVLRVASWKIPLMYAGVRVGGKGNWEA